MLPDKMTTFKDLPIRALFSWSFSQPLECIKEDTIVYRFQGSRFLIGSTDMNVYFSEVDERDRIRRELIESFIDSVLGMYATSVYDVQECTKFCLIREKYKSLTAEEIEKACIDSRIVRCWPDDPTEMDEPPILWPKYDETTDNEYERKFDL